MAKLEIKIKENPKLQQKAESPMYMGGLIKEVIFQEVINNSETRYRDWETHKYWELLREKENYQINIKEEKWNP